MRDSELHVDGLLCPTMSNSTLGSGSCQLVNRPLNITPYNLTPWTLSRRVYLVIITPVPMELVVPVARQIGTIVMGTCTPKKHLLDEGFQDQYYMIFQLLPSAELVVNQALSKQHSPTWLSQRPISCYTPLERPTVKKLALLLKSWA